MGVNLKETSAVDVLNTTDISLPSPLTKTGKNGDEHFHVEEHKLNSKVSDRAWGKQEKIECSYYYNLKLPDSDMPVQDVWNVTCTCTKKTFKPIIGK